MKVVFTDEALRDLGDISNLLSLHYPGLGAAVERRLRVVVGRIGRWPHSARASKSHPGVSVIPLGRYPYKVFYRVTRDVVEILHIHHAAREPWDEQA
jgi:plasmid stabilization system protein ParE